MQIIPFPLKKRMLLHVEHDIKIPCRSPERPGFSAARESDSGTVFHARRNLRVDGTLAENPPVAFAFQTWIGYHGPRSLACRTRSRDAEKALLVAHLPPARARTASCGTFAGRRSRAVAFFASFVTAHHHTRLGTESGFFELNGQILAQIRTTLNPAAASAS